MDIGTRISYFRNAKQYSVNRLATLAGISQSYLRDVSWEKRTPQSRFFLIYAMPWICLSGIFSMTNWNPVSARIRCWPRSTG